ncbi:SpvB/TcaC N-terminal domain-containing protein, partial [Shewanella oncorhynchi]
MLPLRRKSVFIILIALFAVISCLPSQAALTIPDIEVDPVTPFPLEAPSLVGSRFTSIVELRWGIDCSVTTVNIQESTDNQSWTTIYTGLGQADNGVVAYRAALGSGDCVGDWSWKRILQLPNKLQPAYYYRINACKGSSCSAYSPSTLVDDSPAPTTPSAPSFISVPSSNTTGAFSVSWAGVSGASRYELQQRVNGGAWGAKYSGVATSYALSGLNSGTYQYQVRACTTTCSTWTLSSNTQVSLPVLSNDWKNLSRVTVADAGSRDKAPAETVDLTAATVKGNAGVSGGQAGYQIPIDLPPGRNGVQPSISLSYNSQSGNGLLGMGWSLNAGSSISRCGATNAQDGFTKAVTFNATTDRLCLDGQRLIAVSGTYGVSGAEYRTEMDSFIKVVQSGNINASSTSFTAFRPNGSIADYGGSANSRFVPGSLTTALTWKLSQESFSNGANTIDYEYDTSVVGEHLLRRIRYTGSQGQLGERRVDFEYETRDDARISYMYKGLMQSQRRLKRVVTFVSDIQQLTEYNLAYQVSRGTRRSLLKEIELCSSVNSIKQCSPLTTLNWLDTIHYGAPEPLTFSGQEVYKNQKVIESSIPYGDIDGNGTSDFP